MQSAASEAAPRPIVPSGLRLLASDRSPLSLVVLGVGLIGVCCYFVVSATAQDALFVSFGASLKLFRWS